jgi:hypothetical protein
VRVIPSRAPSEAMSIWFGVDDLPRGERKEPVKTYAEVNGDLGRLHRPYLQAADAGGVPERRSMDYRRSD